MTPASGDYLVSALVSTYASARFMRGLLDDLLQQTIADRVEIIVCDSSSPEHEGEIVREYAGRHRNITYLRTGSRENSHVSFNRCIRLARGKYLTTACTDDRRRRDALELMVRALEEHPRAGLVYGDSLITRQENETFEVNSACHRYRWPDFTLAMALATCPFGSQPLWRREVHESIGMFDPELWIAGDQDMFLRISWKFGALRIGEPIGLFLERPDSNSGSARRAEVTADVLRVLKRMRREIPLTDIYPALQDDPGSRGAALLDMGNLFALSPYNDYAMALDFYREAHAEKQASGRLTASDVARFANNSACVFACSGYPDRALQILDRAPQSAEVTANRRILAARDNRIAHPLELVFAEESSEAVEASRRTGHLLGSECGGLRWTPTSGTRPWEVYDIVREHHGPEPRLVALADPVSATGQPT